jgi:hypothetical protein
MCPLNFVEFQKTLLSVTALTDPYAAAIAPESKKY